MTGLKETLAVHHFALSARRYEPEHGAMAMGETTRSVAAAEVAASEVLLVVR